MKAFLINSMNKGLNFKSWKRILQWDQFNCGVGRRHFSNLICV